MHRSTRISLALFGFIGGIWYGTQWGGLSPFMAALSLVAAWRGHGRWAAIGTCLAVACLGAWYVSSWRRRHAALPVTEGTVTFSAVIAEPPDIRTDKTFLTVRPLQPEAAFTEGSGMLLVKAASYPTWSYGQRLEVTGQIELPEPIQSFDYPRYLERNGIYGIVTRPTSLKSQGWGPSNPFLSLLYSFRAALERRVADTIPEPESSLLNGILLGSKRAIPGDIQDALRQTGTSHMVAISGANITILIGMLITMLPLASSRIQWLATLVIASLVTLMTGASASVMRGAQVAVLARYLRLHSRRAKIGPFLAFSAFLMLLGNPLMLVADTGFQLSFAAFAGISYLAGPISGLLERRRLTARLPGTLRSSFAETLAATLGTAPISLISFGTLSLLGLIVNPLVLWMVPPVTALGLTLMALGWIPPVALLLRIPLWLLLHAVLSTIGWFGNLQIGTITLPHAQT